VTNKWIGPAALAVALSACSQSPAPQVALPSSGNGTVPAITEQDLRTRLFMVAADSMGGRPTGSPGHIKATEYLAGELRRS
jgi:hypothetical protein